jgi:hypothetical protein
MVTGYFKNELNAGVVFWNFYNSYIGGSQRIVLSLALPA